MPDGVRLWLRIGVVFIGTALSSSVLQGFPTVEPVLLDRRPEYGAGLFALYCDNKSVSNHTTAPGAVDACKEQLDAAASLYAFSLSASTVTTFIQGYLFDQLGPRSSAVGGSLVTALALALFALALSSPSLNWLAWIAVPLADCAGALTSMASFGFVWHVPKHQGLLSSFYAASISMSVYAAALIPWLVRGPLHLSATVTWLGFAALALVSAALTGACAPSLVEYHDVATAATGAPSRPPAGVLCMCRDVLRHFGMRPCRSCLFFAWASFGFASIIVWAADIVQLLYALMPPEEAQALLGLFALIAGLGGSLVQPVLGRLLDLIGLCVYLPLVNGALGAWFAMLGSHSYSVQVVALSIGVVAQSAYAMLIMKWAARTVPPALVGTAFGIIFGVAGVVSLWAQQAAPLIGQLCGGEPDSARALLLPIWLYGGCTLACGGALSLAMFSGSSVDDESPASAQGSGVMQDGGEHGACGGAGDLSTALVREDAHKRRDRPWPAPRPRGRAQAWAAREEDLRFVATRRAQAQHGLVQ